MQSTRATKYTAAMTAYIARAGHATNAQILAHLRLTHPELSATTVHRITARMVSRGQLNLAPSTLDNAARFDGNITPHDHFHCLSCDSVRDITLPDSLLLSIQQLTAECKLNGRLNIQGTCQNCLGHTEEL
jgi:Fur family peroxide stress response transcriptional regulator